MSWACNEFVVDSACELVRALPDIPPFACMVVFSCKVCAVAFVVELVNFFDEACENFVNVK